MAQPTCSALSETVVREVVSEYLERSALSADGEAILLPDDRFERRVAFGTLEAGLDEAAKLQRQGRIA